MRRRHDTCIDADSAVRLENPQLRSAISQNGEPMPITAVPAEPVDLRSVSTFDVDDQAASLLGWRQHYQQISAGPFLGHTVQARLSGSVCLLRESTNCQLMQRTSPPAGSHTFALLVNAGGDVRVNDQRLSADTLLSTPGDQELQVCVPQHTELAALEVSHSDLADYAAVFGSARDDGRPQRLQVVQTTMAPLLRGFMEQVLSVCRDTPQVLQHDKARQSLKSAAISNLLFALNGADNVRAEVPATSQRRYQLVQQARSHIDAHLGDVFTVADVCKALGVSRRTLQTCFEEVLQINPIAYIRAVRLNAVRRELKRATAGRDTVSDIASRWGFWHLGHFSADYKRMFGELPSATLNTA